MRPYNPNSRPGAAGQRRPAPGPQTNQPQSAPPKPGTPGTGAAPKPGGHKTGRGAPPYPYYAAPGIRGRRTKGASATTQPP